MSIELKPLDEKTVKDSILWFRNKSVTQFTSHGIFPEAEDDAIAYYDKIKRHEVLVYGIFDINADHVGNVSLSNFDWINRSAEIAGVLIPKSSKKGFMTKAMNEMLTHAFCKMNLHRVWCGTPEVNLGMKRVAIKIGMKVEGLIREAFFYKNNYVDIVRYSILQDEFFGRNIEEGKE